jgi:acyl-CoA thioesterase-1
MSYKVIAAFGDSITNGYWDEEGKGGWFGRLQQLIAPAYPYQFGFNNLAQDGDRSFDVLHALKREAMHRTPDYIMLAAGINDTIRWGTPDAPLEMGDTLRDETWERIFAAAKKITPHIMVLSLLPVAESRFPNNGGEGRLLWHLNADVESYNAYLAKAAPTAGALFTDVYTPARTAGWDDYVYDGGHPNARGHQFVADHVFKAMKAAHWLK